MCNELFDLAHPKGDNLLLMVSYPIYMLIIWDLAWTYILEMQIASN